MTDRVKFDVFAVPKGEPAGGTVVHLYARNGDIDVQQKLTPEEAEDLRGRLSHALAVSGCRYGLVERVRETERLYRARLAIRLGLRADDIRAVFDLDAAALARLVQEVRK